MTSLTATRKSEEFREKLASRVLVADGAMGTMLYAKGIFINRCFEELNLSMPGLVQEVHREYVQAGADIIETNTFGANAMRLEKHGFADKVPEINRAAVRLAREAGGEKVFVAGAVGPLGLRIEPLGKISLAEARQFFRQQIDALLEAGVDLIVLETFYDLNELREAFYAAREAGGAELPVVAQVTVNDDGVMLNGTGPEVFTAEIDGWGADAVGANCSSGPKVMLDVVEQILRFTRKPVSAQPNAGNPASIEGRNIYLCSPEYMAQYARRFIWAGVKIVGGCCGTTPEHIKAIKSEVRSLQPAQARLSVTVQHGEAREKAMAPVPLAEKSELGRKIAGGKFVVFVEILPPRGVDAARELAGASLCLKNGIDAINVPDGPRASARMSAQVTVKLIQDQAGIDGVLHFCCRDRNILSIQSELLGAHALGIHNLICITGDPPRMGAYPDATAVFDVDAIGLVNIVHNLNHGLDIGGNPFGSQTRFVIGVGANPGAVNLDEEIRRFEYKVQAGAEYVVTQPVFDLDLLEKFMERRRHARIPIIAGVWPLTSLRNAEFMVNELRVPVPEPLMERMRRADTPEKGREEGVAIAREMVVQLKSRVQGVQLSAPFGRYQMAVDVAHALGDR